MRDAMLRMLATTLVVGAALGGGSAEAVASPSDPTQPSLQELVAGQLELDVTPVPPGMGALFVPALTEARVEPPVVVRRNGVQVAAALTGRRIVLPPGSYTASVSADEGAPKAEIEVRVIEGVTTPVEPFFGGLRLDVVSQSGEPTRTEVIVSPAGGSASALRAESAKSRDFGATETWLLPPGRYVIRLAEEGAPGGSSVGISLHAGEVLEYRLVVRDGQILRAEFREDSRVAKPSIWRFSWVVGVEGSMQQSDRQLTVFSGTAMQAGAFMRTSLGVDTEGHLAMLHLDMDESWLGLTGAFGQELPLQKLRDEATAQVLYSYRLRGLVGPYVRGLVRTSFFDTEMVSNDDVVLSTALAGGGRREELARAGEVQTLLAGTYPLVMQTDVGVGLSPLDNRWVTFWLRGGAGARRALYDGGRVAIERDDDKVTLIQLRDEDHFGAAASGSAVLRLGQRLSYSVTLDALMPYQQLLGDESYRPLYRWEHMATVRLGSVASLVYTLRLARDHLALGGEQATHNLALRLQTALF